MVTPLRMYRGLLRAESRRGHPFGNQAELTPCWITNIYTNIKKVNDLKRDYIIIDLLEIRIHYIMIKTLPHPPPIGPDKFDAYYRKLVLAREW